MAIAKPQDEQLIEKIRMELFSVGILKLPEHDLANAIRKGKSDITFNGNRQTQEYGKPQQMNYTVFLKKYDEPNFYHPHAIEASIENQANKTRKFDLNQVPLSIDQIQNLLNGRSVRKTEFNRLANRAENLWYKINYSKKDAQGQHSLEAVPDKRVSLTKPSNTNNMQERSSLYDVIGRYPIKENLVPDQRLKVILNMLRGEAVPVTVMKNNATSPGYMQFGNRADAIDLLIPKDGKLLRVGPDLKELKEQAIPEPSLKRKGKSL